MFQNSSSYQKQDKICSISNFSSSENTQYLDENFVGTQAKQFANQLQKTAENRFQKPVFIITPDLTSKHINALTQFLQKKGVPIQYQHQTQSLGQELNTQFFVVVDNKNGSLKLGKEFNSPLMTIVGYPKVGSNASNLYSQYAEDVFHQYKLFVNNVNNKAVEVEKEYQVQTSQHKSQISQNTKLQNSFTKTGSSGFSMLRSNISDIKLKSISKYDQKKRQKRTQSENKENVTSIQDIGSHGDSYHNVYFLESSQNQHYNKMITKYFKEIKDNTLGNNEESVFYFKGEGEMIRKLNELNPYDSKNEVKRLQDKKQGKNGSNKLHYIVVSPEAALRLATRIKCECYPFKNKIRLIVAMLNQQNAGQSNDAALEKDMLLVKRAIHTDSFQSVVFSEEECQRMLKSAGFKFEYVIPQIKVTPGECKSILSKSNRRINGSMEKSKIDQEILMSDDRISFCPKSKVHINEENNFSHTLERFPKMGENVSHTLERFPKMGENVSHTLERFPKMGENVSHTLERFPKMGENVSHTLERFPKMGENVSHTLERFPKMGENVSHTLERFPKMGEKVQKNGIKNVKEWMISTAKEELDPREYIKSKVQETVSQVWSKPKYTQTKRMEYVVGEGTTETQEIIIYEQIEGGQEVDEEHMEEIDYQTRQINEREVPKTIETPEFNRDIVQNIQEYFRYDRQQDQEDVDVSFDSNGERKSKNKSRQYTAKNNMNKYTQPQQLQNTNYQTNHTQRNQKYQTLKQPQTQIKQINKIKPQMNQPQPQMNQPQPQMNQPKPQMNQPQQVSKPKQQSPEPYQPQPQINQPQQVSKPKQHSPESYQPQPQMNRPQPQMNQPQPQMNQPQQVNKPRQHSPEPYEPQPQMNQAQQVNKPRQHSPEPYEPQPQMNQAQQVSKPKQPGQFPEPYQPKQLTQNPEPFQPEEPKPKAGIRPLSENESFVDPRSGKPQPVKTQQPGQTPEFHQSQFSSPQEFLKPSNKSPQSQSQHQQVSRPQQPGQFPEPYQPKQLTQNPEPFQPEEPKPKAGIRPLSENESFVDPRSGKPQPVKTQQPGQTPEFHQSQFSSPQEFLKPSNKSPQSQSQHQQVSRPQQPGQFPEPYQPKQLTQNPEPFQPEEPKPKAGIRPLSENESFVDPRSGKPQPVKTQQPGQTPEFHQSQFSSPQEFLKPSNKSPQSQSQHQQVSRPQQPGQFPEPYQPKQLTQNPEPFQPEEPKPKAGIRPLSENESFVDPRSGKPQPVKTQQPGQTPEFHQSQFSSPQEFLKPSNKSPQSQSQHQQVSRPQQPGQFPEPYQPKQLTQNPEPFQPEEPKPKAGIRPLSENESFVDPRSGKPQPVKTQQPGQTPEFHQSQFSSPQEFLKPSNKSPQSQSQHQQVSRPQQPGQFPEPYQPKQLTQNPEPFQPEEPKPKAGIRPLSENESFVDPRSGKPQPVKTQQPGQTLQFFLSKQPNSRLNQSELPKFYWSDDSKLHETYRPYSVQSKKLTPPEQSEACKHQIILSQDRTHQESAQAPGSFQKPKIVIPPVNLVLSSSKSSIGSPTGSKIKFLKLGKTPRTRKQSIFKQESQEKQELLEKPKSISEVNSDYCMSKNKLIVEKIQSKKALPSSKLRLSTVEIGSQRSVDNLDETRQRNSNFNINFNSNFSQSSILSNRSIKNKNKRSISNPSKFEPVEDHQELSVSRLGYTQDGDTEDDHNKKLKSSMMDYGYDANQSHRQIQHYEASNVHLGYNLENAGPNNLKRISRKSVKIQYDHESVASPNTQRNDQRTSKLGYGQRSITYSQSNNKKRKVSKNIYGRQSITSYEADQLQYNASNFGYADESVASDVNHKKRKVSKIAVTGYESQKSAETHRNSRKVSKLGYGLDSVSSPDSKQFKKLKINLHSTGPIVGNVSEKSISDDQSSESSYKKIRKLQKMVKKETPKAISPQNEYYFTNPMQKVQSKKALSIYKPQNFINGLVHVEYNEFISMIVNEFRRNCPTSIIQKDCYKSFYLSCEYAKQLKRIWSNSNQRGILPSLVDVQGLREICKYYSSVAYEDDEIQFCQTSQNQTAKNSEKFMKQFTMYPNSSENSAHMLLFFVIVNEKQSDDPVFERLDWIAERLPRHEIIKCVVEQDLSDNQMKEKANQVYTQMVTYFTELKEQYGDRFVQTA